MKHEVGQRVVVQNRREYLLVDRPTLEDVIATEEELIAIRCQYSLTDREARIIWLLRNYTPIDLSLITAARTHIHTMRKKLKLHNLEIKSLWRGVYELLIVGD